MKRGLFGVLLFFGAFALVVLFDAPNAFAQALEVHSSVDTNEVELGDSVIYTVEATSKTSEVPSDPRITQPAGLTVVESGASPTHMVQIINGRASEQHGLTAQWRLRADRLGTMTVGPGSVLYQGQRVSAPAQRVTVVAPGQGRPKARGRDPWGGRGGHPFAGTPFDPFRGLFPPDDDQQDDPFGGVQFDPKYALGTPRAPIAFLHATVDKTHAVVGEQVTLSVYLYEDLHERQGRPSDVHEATATEFVKRSLLTDESRAILLGNASVGGRPWSVKLVRKSALFPIKAGRLGIDPMSLTLPQARVGLRESEPLFVDVVEPPVAGRPAGYQVGDTGDFSLSATVSPRQVDQHGAVGVNLELRGTGNIPSTLAMPEIQGVEWLEPQVRDALGPVTQDVYGGTRTFNYVARVHKDGQVDLGEVRLPYFDPKTHSYQIARASLGIVSVTKADGRDAGVEAAEPVLANMPALRTQLEGKKEQSFVTEKPAYWGALFGSPLACVLALVLGDAVRRVRERRANAAPSPEKLARERRAEAEAAVRGDDGKAAAAAIVRAVEAEVLADHDVNLRGTSAANAERELVEAGVDAAVAKELLAIVAECESARFSPSAVDVGPIRELWRRAVEALGAAAS